MNDRFEKWERPDIKHGELTKWHWKVLYPENLELGRKTDIGSFTQIQAQEGVTIGDDVQIGPHCDILSVSTIGNERGPIVIGKGAMIGAHSTVMPGVTIGEGAIIGAYSFVKSDIPAGATAYGQPAKVRE